MRRLEKPEQRIESMHYMQLPTGAKSYRTLLTACFPGLAKHGLIKMVTSDELWLRLLAGQSGLKREVS